MDITSKNLQTTHVSHSVLKSIIEKDLELLKSPEISHHLEYCNRCREIVEIITDAQKSAGETKPDTELGHPSRLYLDETITKVYEQSLTPKEAANFLSHLHTCAQCLDYVELTLEDSLKPLPENIEQELALYSKISLAKQALGLISYPPEPTLRLKNILQKINNAVGGLLESVKVRPAWSFAWLVFIIIAFAVGQNQFRTWRAAVGVKAGMNHLQKTWSITPDDLRPASNFPPSIFSVTHGPGESKKADPVVEDFNSALKWDKNNKAAKRGLAIYWCFTGNLERADSLLKELLERDNLDYEAWNILGSVAARRDDTAAALNAFEKALKIRRDYPEAAYNRAMILQQLGRIEEARKAWKYYLTIDRQSEWSRVVKRKLTSSKSP
jgi:tetratricopeptide (TPR) repeat protein